MRDVGYKNMAGNIFAVLLILMIAGARVREVSQEESEATNRHVRIHTKNGNEGFHGTG